MSSAYKPIIGLEIHVELNTKTKMFCECPNKYFGEQPNTHTCPVCLGLPGALPYPNKKALDYCVTIGLALNCTITNFSYFERKNYFYPDLPKGYQISQYKKPFGENGFVEIEINGKKKKIRIRRVHMEEDTGKIIHKELNSERVSLLDFNRSGVPLVEIVTEPDIENGIEAKIFLTKLQQIIKYLGVSDADMEKGNMRLEPNISLLKQGASGLPDYKVEVKNINSFKFVEKAIEFEIVRQATILHENKKPMQETRGWNEQKNQTVSQRSKEEAHDYRYFPEPDIPPIRFSKNEIENLKISLPELPDNKRSRFQTEYLVTSYDADLLTKEKELADFFETTVKEAKPYGLSPKQLANYIINKKVDTEKILPATIVKQIVEEKNHTQVTLSHEDEESLLQVISENPQAVQDYKNGKTQVIGFLMGMSQRKLGAKKIDPNAIKSTLEKLLNTV